MMLMMTIIANYADVDADADADAAAAADNDDKVHHHSINLE